MADTGLTGSEQFMLLAGSITMFGALCALTFQFVLKSRCTTIRCCGVQCERSVVDLTAQDTELGAPNFVSSN